MPKEKLMLDKMPQYLRVKDFNIGKWIPYIKDLCWDFGLNEESFIHSLKCPFGKRDFPKGQSFYLRRYRSMKHYILSHLRGRISLACSIASSIDKKRLCVLGEKLAVARRLEEEARTERNTK